MTLLLKQIVYFITVKQSTIVMNIFSYSIQIDISYLVECGSIHDLFACISMISCVLP